MDTSCIMRLMCQMNVLPLALQITKVAGNLLSRTLIGGRAERNEYLLLHAFNEKGYILPDKQYKKRSVNKVNSFFLNICSFFIYLLFIIYFFKYFYQFNQNEDNVEEENTKKNGRKKAQYLGGLVLDPKIGFYDKMILLMDFNSLYPSIIQEYNICFTTVSFRTLVSQEVHINYTTKYYVKFINTYFKNQSDDEIAELLKLTPNQAVARGILPAEIKSLVDSRREVKKLMNDPKISATLKEQVIQFNFTI